MMRFVLIALLTLAAPAMAESNDVHIRVEHGACRYVTIHIPDGDVTYRAGVDVHGKQVVPADITPPEDYGLKDSFNLRLTADAVRAFGIKVPQLATRGGVNPNVPAVTSDMVFGYIVLKNGKPYLNNRPLDAEGERQLAILCKSQKPE